MNKIKLIVVKPNDTKELIYNNLVLYLRNHGIKIKKGNDEK